MAKPAHVLFVITSSDFGGTESFLLQHVRGLDKARFQPIVVSLRPCGHAARQIAELGIDVSSLEMSSQPKMREMLAAIRGLANCIDEAGVDVVHSLLYRANVLAAIAARWSSARPVVVAGQRSLTAFGGASALRGARWTRRWCHRVVAVSEEVRRALIEREHCDPGRIVVIENGVDCARFKPREPDEVRRALGIRTAALVIGAIGRLDSKKGFHDLIAAVGRVRAESPVHLVLVGDGPERERLEAQACATGLDGRARFLGHRGNVEDLYSAFDVFVLPSYEEGSPNVLLEAMASGCPVVATAVGGIPAILGDPPAGRLVAPGDPDELAAALEDLLRDSATRLRLGEMARRRVKERYEIDGVIQRHEELYLSLLDERR
jgi:L-malate glycosyltransferase